MGCINDFAQQWQQQQQRQLQSSDYNSSTVTDNEIGKKSVNPRVHVAI